MSNNNFNEFAQGILRGLVEGAVGVPYLFVKNYARLGLNEAEAMLFLHIFAFREKEGNSFPMLEEIQSRMSASHDEMIRILQSLMKRGLLQIHQDIDDETGMQYERYDVMPMLAKLAELAELTQGQSSAVTAKTLAHTPQRSGKDHNIFYVFEQEFGRTLSPMECETIHVWIDQDGYSEALIIAALKEAVFAGKVHFRYIDRILIDWSRNNIRSVEQAKTHSQTFRGRH